MLRKLMIISLMSISSLGAMLTPATKNHIKQYKQQSGFIKPGLYKDAQGFVAHSNGTVQRINSYDVEKPLRSLNPIQLQKMGMYIQTNKMTNGDITMRIASKLNGGPAIGAQIGWWTGWIGTNLVAQGGIALVSTGSFFLASAAGGPIAGTAAFKATYTALNTSLQPAIQATAQHVALAVGITGGVVIPG